MSKTYTIERVSSEVKQWKGQYGPMLTYRVMFEGLQEPVEINKKPDSPKPNKGDEVTGTIEDGPFSKKFKAESTFQPSGKKFEPRADHHEEIKAQWSIGQSMALEIEAFKKTDDFNWEHLESSAKRIFAMVERVKAGQTGYEKAKATRDNVLTTQTSNEDEVAVDIGDGEVNLNDIPF